MLFQKKTIDDVLSIFTKAIQDLEKIAEKAEDRAGDIADQIDKLTLESDVVIAEMERARSAANKIKALTL